MFDIWQDIGIFEIIEKCLAELVKVIKSNEWLSKVKMKKINRNLETENNSDIEVNQPVKDTGKNTSSKSSVKLDPYRINHWNKIVNFGGKWEKP